VARHSHAAQVTIELTYGSNEISLTISDDGDGFAVNDRQHGYGLISMQERATALGGTLTIASTAEQGTTVFCTVPVREDIDNDKELTSATTHHDI
jgi:signal transduction histidine kinase